MHSLIQNDFQMRTIPAIYHGGSNISNTIQTSRDATADKIVLLLLLLMLLLLKTISTYLWLWLN